MVTNFYEWQYDSWFAFIRTICGNLFYDITLFTQRQNFLQYLWNCSGDGESGGFSVSASAELLGEAGHIHIVARSAETSLHSAIRSFFKNEGDRTAL